jgi:hypothetical protein
MRMRVLITVKTYPTLSQKYDELVCTAGFNEQGNWVRLFPIPFRKLDFSGQYRKYQWIELDVIRNSEDPRPETYRPTNVDDIRVLESLDTDGGTWRRRKEIVLAKPPFQSMEALIEAAKDPERATSLAVFKPRRILDFTWEEESVKDWDSDKLARLNQQNLFEERGSKFSPVRKLPVKFRYAFESESGKRHELMIEDWETGALFWRGFEKFGNLPQACEYVREKYLNAFASDKHDLYFFLGTTREWHFRAPNPFIIIGTFHPMIDLQTSLL